MDWICKLLFQKIDGKIIMIFIKALLVFSTITQILVGQEAQILTTFTVAPLNSTNSDQIQLGQFFTPNHHAYPLDPSPLKMNQVRRPIFSGKEATTKGFRS